MSNSEPFQIRDSYIRVDTMADTYARIAEHAFAFFLDDAADPRPLFCPPYDPTGAMDREDRKIANGIKTIVFSEWLSKRLFLTWLRSSWMTK